MGRFLAPQAGAAAAIILVACTLAGCSSSPNDAVHASRRGGAAASANPKAASQAHDKLPDLLLTQFPATSAEYNSNATSAWGDFVTVIQSNISANCVEKQGFTRAAASQVRMHPTGTVPPNNLQYPDLARLATGQTGTAVDVPIPAGSDGSQGRLNFSQNPAVPKDQQAAYRAAIGMCTNEGLRPFIPFLNALAPLQKAWADDLAKLPDNPEVRSATTKWRTCMDADGIPSTIPQAFFASLDAKAAALPKSEYLAEQSKLVKSYAKCVEPLSDAQDRVRTGFRKQLSDDFAPQIADLQSQMNALVTRLSMQYGVRYGDEH